MAKSLKFYYDLLSPPSRALYIFLAKNKIQHEKISVALRKGEHLSEDYKKNVNRFAKVPCINHDGFLISESHAIARYLIRELNIDGDWYPNDSRLQAKIDQYLSWSHNNLRLNSGLLFFEQWIFPIQKGSYGNPKKIEKYKKDLFRSLDAMENIWLKSSKFILSDKLTIADVFASSDIEQSRICGLNPCEKRPHIEKWLNEVKSILNPHFDDAHLYVYKYSAKYNGIPPIENK